MANRFKGPVTEVPAVSAPQPMNRFKGPVSSDPVDAYNQLPWYAQAAQAADDTVRLMANGMTFGQMDKLAAWAGSSDVEAERKATAEAKARAGSAGVADEIIGGGMTGYLLPSVGSGYLGSLGTGALYGGIDGGLRDAETWTDRAKNAAVGAGAGGALGVAAHGATDLVGAGLNKAGQMWRAWGTEPAERAAAKVADLADSRYGGYNAMSMDRDMANLGPEAVRVDVLGETGRSVNRRAANISPEARETAETFAFGRKAAQNERLAGDIQRAGGVPVGSRVPVEKMKADAYEAVRPGIHQAYDTARRAGSDVDLTVFKDILDTPDGSAAFDQAFRNVSTRAVTDGASDGNLAVLDEVQRILSKKATKGYRESDPQADVYASLARTIKERTDNLLGSGDEYATARAMRADAYRTAEAYDAGENLARRAPGFDDLAAGRKVGPQNAQARAKAYAQTKAESLLSSPSTDAALGQFSTVSGREAAQVGLGDRGAATLADAVSREKTFNLLPKSLGNSSTARQTDELVNPALDALAGGFMAGGQFVPGLSALGARLARNGVISAVRGAVNKSERMAAPHLVENLLGRGVLPGGAHLDRTALEKLASSFGPLTAARVLLGAGIGGMEAQRDSLAGSFN